MNCSYTTLSFPRMLDGRNGGQVVSIVQDFMKLDQVQREVWRVGAKVFNIDEGDQYFVESGVVFSGASGDSEGEGRIACLSRVYVHGS